MNNSAFTKSITLVFQMLMSHLYGGGAENVDAAILDILEVREHKIDRLKLHWRLGTWITSFVIGL